MADPKDSSQAAQDDQELAQLREQLTALQAEVEKLRDIAARAQADLQNAKARVEREGDELRKFATAAVIQKILPTIDNFQRAVEHLPEDLKGNEWAKGIVATEQDLMKKMTEVGLRRMQSLGEVVDPQRHEVLSIGPGEVEKVAEIFEEGYELHGKVIRPAKVRAGDGSSAI